MEIDSSDDDQPMELDDENGTTKNLIAGKIVSIHLKNFLTHTEATVYPSEQLNLVCFLAFWIECIHLTVFINANQFQWFSVEFLFRIFRLIFFALHNTNNCNFHVNL